MRPITLGFSLVLSTAAAAQCIPAPGAAIAIGQDTITGPNPIGFNFPYEGMTYSDIHLSDHGICFLSNAGVPAPPAATPLVYAPAAASLVTQAGPVICPFWSDTIPGTSAQFFIDAQPTVCTITWQDVNSFGLTTPLMTFQLKLFNTGQMEMIYGPTVTNNSTFMTPPAQSGVVGVSPGGNVALPAAVDLSTSPASTDVTVFEEWTMPQTFDMANDHLMWFPTLPGWTVVHVNNGAGCASSNVYGAGCNGLALDSSTLPLLGANWDLTTTGVDPVSSIAVTYFGLAAQNPPIPLSSLGLTAPGCEVHITPLLNTLLGTVTAGSATVSLAIPMGFGGTVLTAQSVAISSANLTGVDVSNGVRGVLGN